MAEVTTPTSAEATTPETLTARQRSILDFIKDTLAQRGYPPTVREIGEAVGLNSSSSVHSQLANLERMGMLHRDPTKPRAVTLAESEQQAPSVSVPLVGRIAAGAPVLATEAVEDYLAIPEGYAPDNAELFALKITGDSMIGAGIFDGDVVVLRSQATATDGDIVAVLLPGPAEEEATVKRFKRVGEKVMLVPENPALEPFEMTDGRILGKVTTVLRRL